MLDDPHAQILLIVEDNLADAELVREYLDIGKSYEFIHAPRLNEAERILSTQKIDVVLLDLQLPDSSGLASVEAILRITRDVPVVVLTGRDDEVLALRCIDAGAQDYVSKDELRPLGLQRTLNYAATRLREERRLRATLLERDFLLAELHHRVTNNLQQITALIAIERAKVADERGRDALESISRRVRALGIVHKMLVNSSPSQAVDLAEFLPLMCGKLVESYGLDQRGVSLETHAAQWRLPADTAILIGLLIHELVTNAAKHAFTETDGGAIVVKLDSDVDGGVALSVTDNGKGHSGGAREASTGAGMNVVQDLVRQLGGALTVDGSSGMRIVIKLPPDPTGGRAGGAASPLARSAHDHEI